jgi:signal transduction histidine kinase
VDVATDGARVTLTVTDDGAGISGSGRRGGLAWTVPLPG